ncbi:MAG TPA: hypothetical protein VGJ15_03860 [Pirellulales bacterium]|jgi:hypothetical protein
MQWLVLLAACVLAIVVATLLISCAAHGLCSIARPTVRKWLAVFGVMFFWSCVGVSIYLSLTLPRDDSMAATASALILSYQSLPTWTLLRYVPLICGVLWFVFAGMYGLLPEPGVPYEPRAVHWNLLWLLIRGGFVLSTLLILILAQDVELCARLRSMEARADKLLPSHRPASVDEQQNAAKHYQRVVALMDARREPSYETRRELDALLDAGGPLNSKVEAYFQPIGPIFEELRAASKCTACCYDDDVIVVEIPDNLHVNVTVDSALSELSRYANWQSCRQNPLEAIEAIKVIRRWEEHLQQDHRNVGAEMFVWTEHSICQIVQHLTAHCPKLPAAELKTLLVPRLPIDSIRESTIRWEAVTWQKSLPEVYDGRAYSRPDMREQADLASNSLQGRLTRIMMRLIFARDELASVENRFKCLEVPFDDRTWGVAEQPDGNPRGHMAATFWSTAMSKYFIDLAGSYRDLANIGIATALYHQDHQAWPSKLADLAPDYVAQIPSNPTWDEEFSLMMIDGGIVVYARSEDKQLANAENEEQKWRELSQTTLPILFFGTAFEKVQKARQQPN